MAPAGGQPQLQDVIAWVQRHPALAAGITAALYPAALVLRPLVIQALPYIVFIIGLAGVRDCSIWHWHMASACSSNGA